MKQLLMTALLIAVGATAWAVDLKLPPGKWWENPVLVERVRLTEEQQEQIHRKVYEHSLRMIDLKADVDREELKLRSAVEDGAFDPDQVRAAFAAFQQARIKLEKERFELLLSVRQILSPEQWRQLQSLHQEVQRRRADSLRGDRRRPAPGQGPRPHPPE